MAHLLIIELPGGNDTDLIEAARAGGHAFTFLSARLDHYRRQPAVWAALGAGQACVEVPGFAQADLQRQVLAIHARRRIDAVLCLIDIRLIETARIAAMLGLRHLNPASAVLLRDKLSVRRRLAEVGIAQPDFELAESNAQLKAAVQRLGLPVLIKPADGYGSQNIVALRHPQDLDPLMSPLEDMLPSRADYGLGVVANDRLLVERYMTGRFIGVDTFTRGGRHTVLGVHEKLMFEPPSFAMRGSTFLPHCAATPVPGDVERYVCQLLDAVGYDWGATHIEIMLTAEGPRLIEINPRLVGARLPRLVSHALGLSVHADLIDLHLGLAPAAVPVALKSVGVIRWLVAARSGRLEAVHLPSLPAAHVRCVEILKHAGDSVSPPFENADRIGYVMACAEDRLQAEASADAFVTASRVSIGPAVPSMAAAVAATR
jgi:biotin carboxylase